MWRHLRPNQELPLFAQYLEDRDLWRFKLPNSKEVSAFIRTLPYDFKVWDETFGHSTGWLRLAIAGGQVALRLTSRMVEDMVDRSYMKKIGRWEVPVANATVFYSEVPHALLKKFPDAPFAAGYFDVERDGKMCRQWSLRSEDDDVEKGHRIDVSEVAKMFGGGGHRNAAGFYEELEFGKL